MFYGSTNLRLWISFIDDKIRKSLFNRNVAIYKSIVYGNNYGEDNTSYNSGLSLYGAYSNPKFRPYVSDVNRLIDYWVSNLETTIWNYSQPAFQLLPNQIGLENDPDLLKYYNNISQFLLDKFNDPLCNFKKAFNSFIRDWYEFGLAVIFIDKTPLGQTFITIPPELVSIEFGETHNIERVVFSLRNVARIDEFTASIANGYFDPVNDFNYTIQDEIYRIFERNNSTNTWKSSQYIYKTKEDKLYTIYKDKHHEYQPIYVSTYTPRSGNRIGDGMGLYILPSLVNINNMLKTLEETAYTALIPSILVPEGQIDTQKQELYNNPHLIQSLGCKILTKSYNGSSDQLPIQPLPVNSNPAQTLYLIEMYKKDIRDVLMPNQMVLAKGESGMSTQETQMRDAYDRVSISSKAALIADDVVISLIKYMANVFKNKFPTLLIDESLDDVDSFQRKNKIQKNNMFKNIDIMNFRVRVRNVSGDQHIRERMIDMNSYMSIVERAMNLKQAGINTDQILSEAAKLFSISSDTEQNQLMQYQSLMQTASQVAQNNIENNRSV
ncbi:MAG: hypothetical protein ACRCST_13550 [Turicibacter sp.]